MAGRPKKEFHEYLTEATNSHVGHEDYIISPATAFLKYAIEAKSAIDLCVRKFPKVTDGGYSKDSYDSLQHLIVSILPTIMGHFETFERYLFAGMFDYSVYLENFKVKSFFDYIDKQSKLVIDPIRLSAYRNIGASSVGIMLSDSLSGWHDSKKVNEFFNAFKLHHQLYSEDDCTMLSILWQFRHSIVHTGGTLTLPDAQKVKVLKQYAGRQIAFDNNFIFEVARKLHPLIKKSTEGIGAKYKCKLMPNTSSDIIRKIDKFFEVKSSISVWFQ